MNLAKTRQARLPLTSDFDAEVFASLCVCRVVAVALRALHRRLSSQFVKQRLGILQVGGIEALGEPAVDFREYRARLVAISLLARDLRQHAVRRL